MAESYFKDPLLEKWAAECAPETMRYLGSDHRDANPVSVLDTIDAMPRPFSTDRERLRTLISAELSGARRARERAKAIVAEHVNDSIGVTHNLGRTCAAEEILEAFDGE